MSGFYKRLLTNLPPYRLSCAALGRHREAPAGAVAFQELASALEPLAMTGLMKRHRMAEWRGHMPPREVVLEFIGTGGYCPRSGEALDG